MLLRVLRAPPSILYLYLTEVFCFITIYQQWMCSHGDEIEPIMIPINKIQRTVRNSVSDCVTYGSEMQA